MDTLPDGASIVIQHIAEMNNICYSAITGGYDIPKIQPRTPGWDFICYSDHFFVTSNVKSIFISPSEKPALTAREIKITGFSKLDCDISIWIDGTIEIVGDLNEFVQSLDWRYDFHIMKHPWRNCIYREALGIISVKKDNAFIVNQQMNKYRAEGYRANNGLVGSGIIVRKNTKANRDFCEAWFAEVKHFSIRDQLSFNYVAHKMNFQYSTFDFLNPKYFKHHPHVKNRNPQPAH